VTSAGGAVGSDADQVVALNGARVVGFVGTDEKVAFLKKELIFDAAINYAATEDYDAALKGVAPGGVDSDFDNVGGDITDTVFSYPNVDARVAVCEQIALYNATEIPIGPRKLGMLIEERATAEGFLLRDFAPHFEHAIRQLGEWIATGDI